MKSRICYLRWPCHSNCIWLLFSGSLSVYGRWAEAHRSGWPLQTLLASNRPYFLLRRGFLFNDLKHQKKNEEERKTKRNKMLNTLNVCAHHRIIFFFFDFKIHFFFLLWLTHNRHNFLVVLFGVFVEHISSLIFFLRWFCSTLGNDNVMLINAFCIYLFKMRTKFIEHNKLAYINHPNWFVSSLPISTIRHAHSLCFGRYFFFLLLSNKQ